MTHVLSSDETMTLKMNLVGNKVQFSIGDTREGGNNEWEANSRKCEEEQKNTCFF